MKRALLLGVVLLAGPAAGQDPVAILPHRPTAPAALSIEVRSRRVETFAFRLLDEGEDEPVPPEEVVEEADLAADLDVLEAGPAGWTEARLRIVRARIEEGGDRLATTLDGQVLRLRGPAGERSLGHDDGSDLPDDDWLVAARLLGDVDGFRPDPFDIGLPPTMDVFLPDGPRRPGDEWSIEPARLHEALRMAEDEVDPGRTSARCRLVAGPGPDRSTVRIEFAIRMTIVRLDDEPLDEGSLRIDGSFERPADGSTPDLTVAHSGTLLVRRVSGGEGARVEETTTRRFEATRRTRRRP